jgi:diaminohydroxyphosphoribosylaminopyrimidine deaminase / 5-amino-6-(5-phosphoribosylamino)uracil reductase
MNSIDEKFMQMALKLAVRGAGAVEPNPMVGCVIVKEGKIIGRGWHKKFGGPHAEINALADCKAKGFDPKGATMYVTLEPCCHEGKTGPCVEAIISAGISKVFAATIDPSAHCCGKSIEQLHSAGIVVQVGICEKDAITLNAPFIKFAITGKTWIIIKWAQSIDGKIAWVDELGVKRWITNKLSRQDSHNLRRRCQAILVGIETVLADNPLLTPRPPKGRKPARIVLDSHLRIPLDCNLLATAKETPVIIATTRGAVESQLDKAAQIKSKGAEILPCPTVNDHVDIQFLLNELSKRGIAQLLVEGGAKVIDSFLKLYLTDEICVYIAPRILGSQGQVNVTEPMDKLAKVLSVTNTKIVRFGDDVRISGIIEIEKSLEDIFTKDQL